MFNIFRSTRLSYSLSLIFVQVVTPFNLDLSWCEVCKHISSSLLESEWWPNWAEGFNHTKCYHKFCTKLHNASLYFTNVNLLIISRDEVDDSGAFVKYGELPQMIHCYHHEYWWIIYSSNLILMQILRTTVETRSLLPKLMQWQLVILDNIRWHVRNEFWERFGGPDTGDYPDWYVLLTNRVSFVRMMADTYHERT